VADRSDMKDEAPQTQEASARQSRSPREERRADETPWRVEGAGQGGGTNPQLPDGPQQGGLRWGRMVLALVAVLVLNWLLASVLFGSVSTLPVSYTFFRTQVEAGNVAQVTAKGSAIQGTFKGRVTRSEANGNAPAKNEPSYTAFKTEVPAFGNQGLQALLDQHGVVVTAKPGGTPWWQSLLTFFLPAILLWALFVWYARRAQASGGMSGMMGMFGKSKARKYEPEESRTTFADVAGIDEAKEELAEVVDFLRNPDRYCRLGARIPRGVLLSGQPGTGKTLLARAVAGEAQVPFFWMSASEFVEMFVGVGASRVRDLFTQAKSSAPSIIFIDELDAIGRARSAGGQMGGNDEREQTLNQILTEMDGFTGDEGVIVMAATNRPEVLDSALLRPGRFDRRITVNAPDQKGRAQILRVHTRDVPLAPDVELDKVAGDTAGMVGADLANLVNEAALSAARHGEQQVESKDFSAALERIILGTERRIVLSPLEKERTAYHESGHALLGMLQSGADPVRKISIVPRGQALGVTYQSPTADRYGYPTSYLRGRIIGALGGRAAEALVYNDVTNGAESDLEQVTAIARQMVGRWGMSEAVGQVSVLPRDGQSSPFDASGPSQETRKLVDDEVRRIVDECYEEAQALLHDNRGRLDRLAHALLERESLDEEQAYAAAGVAHAHAQAAADAGADALAS
jgi:cell division protease FtsH